MTKEEAIGRIIQGGFTVKDDVRVNNCGNKLTLSNGAVVNVFDKGTYNVQGKNREPIEVLLASNAKVQVNKKVFVVYGHDQIAKTSLRRC